MFLTLLSMTINILTLGRWGETFCCRVYRCWLFDGFPGEGYWLLWRVTLDWTWESLFRDRDHCQDQYIKYGKP